MSRTRASTPALALLAMVVAMAAYAQVDLNDPETKRAIRAEYNKSPDLPDGVAFLTAMRSLYVINSEDRDTAVAWIESEMGLLEPDSERFLNRMLERFAAFKADYNNFERHLACPSGNARAVGDEVYPILEALDDARWAIATQHLAAMKVEVGKEQADRLQQWLELSKLNITHVTFRHKEAYAKAGASPDETLSGICDELNKQGGS